MGESSYVLKSLRILGLEEILKLSQALQAKQVPLKKAAGEDLVVWDGPPQKQKKNQEEAPAKILEFPKKRSFEETGPEKEAPVTAADLKPTEEYVPHEQKEVPHFVSSEMLLWQRELSKEVETSTHKKDAMKGYQRATEMYVVKSQDHEGKEKIRFASTNGVLVNKKQA